MSLLGGEVLGHEPGTEVLFHTLLPALDLEHAEGGTNEVDQIAAGIAVSTAQVVFIEVALWLIQTLGELGLFSFSQCIAGLDLGDDGISLSLLLDGRFPICHVIALVNTLTIGPDLDVVNGVQPLVFQPQFNQLARGLAAGLLRLWRVATGAAAGEDVGVRVVGQRDAW